jgi:hypothetical protein
MTAKELDKMMVEQFGADYRNKTLVGPLESFPLAGVFEECGLVDPQYREPLRSFGLWQMIPSVRR